MNPRRIALIEQVSMIRDRKKQVYLFSLVTFVVVLILVIGAIKPSIETIVRIQSEIKAKEVALQALEDKINALNNLSLQFAEFEDTAEDFKLLYPSNGDFSLFLANIETLSTDENMELTSIGFDDKADGSDENEVLESMNIVMRVRGERKDLIPFLKKMEALPMYPVIDSVSFSTEDKSEEDEEDTAQNDEETTNADEEEVGSVFDYSVTMHIYGVPIETFYD